MQVVARDGSKPANRTGRSARRSPGRSRLRTLALAGGLAGLLVAALGGCDSSGATGVAAAPSSTAAGGAGGSTSTTGAGGNGGATGTNGGQVQPPADGPVCQSAQLEVKLTESMHGSVGYTDWVFSVRNTSVTPCVLSGYPTVQLLDAKRLPLTTVEERGAGPGLTGRVAMAVALPPGGGAVFGIETYACRPPVAAQAPAPFVAVTPPGGSTALIVTADPVITSCGDGRVVTSPVRSDPSGVAT